MNIPEAQRAFGRLLEIIERLRGPGGCPWDREQTPMTLRRTLTEEAYELIHAIEQDDAEGAREELGDVALNVAMLGEMFENGGRFRLAEALDGVCEKLIRRHPHVFGESTARTPDEVVAQWEAIKVREKDGRPTSLLHKAGRGLPPLEKAQEVQKKAATVGFDWTRTADVFEKIREELDEVRAEWDGADPDRLELEIGDLLFSVVNLARRLNVDASLALHRSIEKFLARFRYIEEVFATENRPLDPTQNARMEELWEEAKRRR